MTLKFRNRFFVALLAIFSLILTSLLVFFFIAFVKDRISFPEFSRFPGWLENFEFLPFNSYALFISMILLSVYSIVCIAVLISNFEKTNSIEIIFFAGFLISCFFEGLRILPCAFNIWQPMSGPIFLCTRCVLACRVFAPVTFVFAAIMIDDSLSQSIEQRFLFGALASCIIASMLPIDTTKFTSTMLCFWGFSKQLIVIRALVFISALISFIIEAKKSGEGKVWALPLWSTVLFSGYAILTSCDTIFFLAIGLALLTFGTIQYLKTIHQSYLWR